MRYIFSQTMLLKWMAIAKFKLFGHIYEHKTRQIWLEKGNIVKLNVRLRRENSQKTKSTVCQQNKKKHKYVDNFTNCFKEKGYFFVVQRL